MGRFMLRLAGVAAVVAAIILASLTLALAHTSAPAQSHPLDCIHWTITDNGGSGPAVHWLICSAIPKDQGGDSPARDSTNWHHFIVDGGPAFPHPPQCGLTWATACVME